MARPLSLGAAAVAALALSLLPDAALGQDTIELNERAIALMIEGDNEGAIELLQQSLDLADLNVTWLNLGRAYARAGRCSDALVAYDRMAVAPRVDEPPPDVLFDVLKTYRAELLTDCPGTVVVSCGPELELVVDDGTPEACVDGPREMVPGTHTFAALRDGEIADVATVDVIGMSTAYVELRASGELPLVGSGGADGGSMSPWTVAGIALASSGAAVLLGGLVFDAAVVGPNADRYADSLAAAQTVGEFERADALRAAVAVEQDVTTALYATGGGLLLTGTAAIVLGLVLDGDEGEAEGVALDLRGDGASLVWRGTLP